MIVEAMKMENHVVAPKDAIVSKLNVKKDDVVTTNSPMVILE